MEEQEIDSSNPCSVFLTQVHGQLGSAVLDDYECVMSSVALHVMAAVMQ